MWEGLCCFPSFSSFVLLSITATSRSAMVLAATLALVPPVALAQTAATPPALVTERTLSFSAAHEAALGALEQCRKDGYKVTVTVVNRAGRTTVVLHDDGANPHTIENSLRKAYTSLTFRTPSGEFGKRVTSSPTGAGAALHLDKVTTAEGALPMAGLPAPEVCCVMVVRGRNAVLRTASIPTAATITGGLVHHLTIGTSLLL